MDGQRPLVLVVDDDPADRELILNAIARSGQRCQVEVATDGQEALDFLDRPDPGGRRPVCMLLDLKLPRIDGFEVLRRVRADAHNARLPVVALTSSLEARDLSACYDLGVNSYVIKPINYEDFNATIAGVVTYWAGLNRNAEPGV